MKKNKTKNPLIRRMPKELIGDWKKYLVSQSVYDFCNWLYRRYVCGKREYADSGNREYKKVDLRRWTF